jgi:IS5 family transposase
MQLDFLLDKKIYQRLDRMNDPLARLDEIMDWSPFTRIIDEVRPDRTKTGLGGRPPISSLVMFKGLLLGKIYNLSYDQIEYQITDRVSFMRFCGLDLGEKSPDAKSFWLLNERLNETGKYNALFDALLESLSDVGLEYSKCAIVDASFVEAPRNRRLKKEQYEALKEHDNNPDTPLPFELDKEQVSSLESHLPGNERTMSNILRQTDTDAQWAKKGKETYYGYKDHVVVDAKTKLIIANEVTSAHVHDSQKLVDIVPEGTEVVYDDSGYTGAGIDEELKMKFPGIEHFTAKKAHKNKPLTEEDKKFNREFVSPIRARVEHIFGRLTYCMGGMFVRSIGIARAKCHITLRDFAYNIMRYSTLVKLGKAKIMQA